MVRRLQSSGGDDAELGGLKGGQNRGIETGERMEFLQICDADPEHPFKVIGYGYCDRAAKKSGFIVPGKKSNTLKNYDGICGILHHFLKFVGFNRNLNNHAIPCPSFIIVLAISAVVGKLTTLRATPASHLERL